MWLAEHLQTLGQKPGGHELHRASLSLNDGQWFLTLPLQNVCATCKAQSNACGTFVSGACRRACGEGSGLEDQDRRFVSKLVRLTSGVSVVSAVEKGTAALLLL